MFKFTVPALFAGLLLSSSVSVAEGASNPTAEAVQNALHIAEQARQRAASVDYEWRDTAKILQQAQAALAHNDLAKALQLAQLAKLQSDMAVVQAEQQKTAGPRIQ